jgi:hypothetical protein
MGKIEKFFYALFKTIVIAGNEAIFMLYRYIATLHINSSPPYNCEEERRSI